MRKNSACVYALFKKEVIFLIKPGFLLLNFEDSKSAIHSAAARSFPFSPYFSAKGVSLSQITVLIFGLDKILPGFISITSSYEFWKTRRLFTTFHFSLLRVTETLLGPSKIISDTALPA